MRQFAVTYEVITPASARDGDAAERGFVAERVSLREALQRARQWDGFQCSSSHPRPGDWFIDGPEENYTSGAETIYSVHPPRSITAASMRRLVRLIANV